MGGAIAILFAGCYPDAVTKLVTIEGIPPHSAPASASMSNMRRYIDLNAKRGDRIAENSNVYSTLHDAIKVVVTIMIGLMSTRLALALLKPIRVVRAYLTSQPRNSFYGNSSGAMNRNTIQIVEQCRRVVNLLNTFLIWISVPFASITTPGC